MEKGGHLISGLESAIRVEEVGEGEVDRILDMAAPEPRPRLLDSPVKPCLSSSIHDLKIDALWRLRMVQLASKGVHFPNIQNDALVIHNVPVIVPIRLRMRRTSLAHGHTLNQRPAILNPFF